MEEDQKVYPEWFYFCDLNPQFIKDINHNDLVFANYDHARIIKQDNPALKTPPYFQANTQYQEVSPFSWEEISKDYAGILVTEPGKGPAKFEGWDMETLAVWDYSALTDVVVYWSTGDFTYF